jgi:hypothetical protein
MSFSSEFSSTKSKAKNGGRPQRIVLAAGIPSIDIKRYVSIAEHPCVAEILAHRRG